MHIAIITTRQYYREKPIKEAIVRIRDLFGPTATILSGGNDGGEALVKKFALAYELGYKEFNPAYTGRRSFSAMGDDYYTKKKPHPTQFLHRYQLLVRACDVLIVFEGDDDDKAVKYAVKQAEKGKKKVTIIKQKKLVNEQT